MMSREKFIDLVKTATGGKLDLSGEIESGQKISLKDALPNNDMFDICIDDSDADNKKFFSIDMRQGTYTIFRHGPSAEGGLLFCRVSQPDECHFDLDTSVDDRISAAKVIAAVMDAAAKKK